MTQSPPFPSSRHLRAEPTVRLRMMSPHHSLAVGQVSDGSDCLGH
jgi:hypothetical protein